VEGQKVDNVMTVDFSPGKLLKSTYRAKEFPLYLVTLGDETEYQFKAIVVFDNTTNNEVGEISNSWNKPAFINCEWKELDTVKMG
jgi:hypothetical protein